MRRRRPSERNIGRVLAAVLAIATAACGGDGRADTQGRRASGSAASGATIDSIVVTDAGDRRLSLPGPARRIVSLVPSATKTLHALGADGRLVGRTDYDTQAWASELPSVGGGLDPSIEAIVALEPDLVIRFGGEQDTRTPKRLDELRIPYLTVRPDRIADILETARLLGAVTGREAEAESLTTTIEDGLELVREEFSDEPPLSAAYVLGGSPPWVSGPGTYIAEVLEIAGVTNAFDDLEALYSAVSPEVLRTREIDVVLVSAPGQYDESLTPDARVVVLGDLLDMPGPDVVEAARRVAELLHEPSSH